MQRQEITILPVRPRQLSNALGKIVNMANGLRVLNVGASGGVEHYLPHNRVNWLHQNLSEAASELVGIDIDQDSINFAAEHGVHILFADCETYQAKSKFDLIVMSDVIEHVNSAVPAIENLARQLNADGCIVITTPNLTHYGLVLKSWFGRVTSVYYDHTAGFLPEHFNVIGNRLGLNLSEIYFFSHSDLRSNSMRIKSALARLMGFFIPRSHSSVMVVLVKGRRGS